jgi:hypothetical protein
MGCSVSQGLGSELECTASLLRLDCVVWLLTRLLPQAPSDSVGDAILRGVKSGRAQRVVLADAPLLPDMKLR